ncbi:GTPase HflX [Hazenella coriacea]|uniref:GTPase HflX n=1 Tax=Hazenella coriacea TaxID=1179467 RepID=A0A4R3L2E9_9BACL|nr:GTPase HflX [Hazenella coriacea]TCS93811.1 GTP-binding protein HflX [Hazenella coriacea]
MGCGPKQKEWEIQSSLAELVRLAETSQAEVIDQVIQHRDRPDPGWMVGKGKAEEIAQLAEELEADLVIFDQELSPAQVNHLEQKITCKVIDRTQCILDIFAQRAQTKEGRLQVELAQLQYLLPRLVGRGKELSRLGGGIGTRGPGEKKLETDRRHIRRQIRALKQELEEVKKHRRLHRDRRKKIEQLQVALVGYTNAGKSTLLNRLTGAEVLAENRLFATLDPTSRLLDLPSGQAVLLTDTVGFIRHLPHDLVAAFRSTLEQVREADLLLHVVDSSHPEATQQMETVEQVLTELEAAHIPRLTVFNKTDQRRDQLDIPIDEWNHEDSIHISALEETDLERLKKKIAEVLSKEFFVGTAWVPTHRGEWISHFYQVAEVLHSEADDQYVKLQMRIPKRQFQKLHSDIKACIQEDLA